MSDEGGASTTETELWRLERRIEDLIELCERLRADNHSLQTRQEQLIAERARLVEKTDLVQGRVEAMMSRLKSIEQDP